MPHPAQYRPQSHLGGQKEKSKWGALNKMRMSGQGSTAKGRAFTSSSDNGSRLKRSSLTDDIRNVKRVRVDSPMQGSSPPPKRTPEVVIKAEQDPTSFARAGTACPFDEEDSDEGDAVVDQATSLFVTQDISSSRPAPRPAAPVSSALSEGPSLSEQLRARSAARKKGQPLARPIERSLTLSSRFDSLPKPSRPPHHLQTSNMIDLTKDDDDDDSQRAPKRPSLQRPSKASSSINPPQRFQPTTPSREKQRQRRDSGFSQEQTSIDSSIRELNDSAPSSSRRQTPDRRNHSMSRIYNDEETSGSKNAPIRSRQPMLDGTPSTSKGDNVFPATDTQKQNQPPAVDLLDVKLRASQKQAERDKQRRAQEERHKAEVERRKQQELEIEKRKAKEAAELRDRQQRLEQERQRRELEERQRKQKQVETAAKLQQQRDAAEAKRKAEAAAAAEKAAAGLRAAELDRERQEIERRREERLARRRQEDLELERAAADEKSRPPPRASQPKPASNVFMNSFKASGSNCGRGTGASSGPMSLNSAAGQVAITQPANTASATSKDQVSQDKSNSRRSSVSLGKNGLNGMHSNGSEIVASDAHILSWRDQEGLVWADIAPKFEQLTGKKMSPPTIKKRYELVNNAMKDAKVGPSLLKRLKEGDHAAKKEINQLIDGGDGLVLDTEPEMSASVEQQSETALQIPAPQSATKNSTSATTTALTREIIESDAQIVYWRDRQGLLINEIVVAFEKKYQRKTSKTSVSRKYQKAKDLIEELGINDDLLDGLRVGDVGAKSQIRQLIARQRSKVPIPDTEEVQRPRPTIKIASQRPLSPSGEIPDPPAQAVRPVQTEESATTEPRPTTGGKTLDENYFLYHMDALHHSLVANEEAEAAEIDDDEGQTEHFVYHVYRRFLTPEQLEEFDEDPDSVDTLFELVDSFDSLEVANMFAWQEAHSVRDETPEWITGDFQVTSSKLDHGLRTVLRRSEEHGGVQTLVERTLIVSDERRTIDAPMLPKTLYMVVQRIATKSGKDEELFDEHASEHVEEILDRKHAFTDLDKANGRAIQLFVDLIYTPSSSNFRVIDAEKLERIRTLSNRLIADDMFSGHHEVNGGTRVVDVEVVEVEVEGPRNVW